MIKLRLNGDKMEYLSLAFTLPTLIFSTLLCVVLLFWLITLIGFADIDMLDGDVSLSSDDIDPDAAFTKFGFGELPVTVVISMLVMFGWLNSIYLHKFFGYLLGEGVSFYFMSMVMVLVSVFGAMPLVVLLAKPLQRFFDSKEAASKEDMLGLECTIATSKVSDTFGQAKIMFQGAEQLIEVRTECETPFKLGDRAVLLEHNKEQHFYTITATPW